MLKLDAEMDICQMRPEVQPVTRVIVRKRWKYAQTFSDLVQIGQRILGLIIAVGIFYAFMVGMSLAGGAR